MKKAIDISASSLGRLTLMAIESYNEAYSENAKGQGTNDYDIANRAYTNILIELTRSNVKQHVMSVIVIWNM